MWQPRSWRCLNLGEAMVQRFEEVVAASPQIIRCVSATGPADYLLHVTVPDMKHCQRFLHKVLFSLPGVAHVRSSIVLRDIKSEVVLPLGCLFGTKAGAAPSRRQKTCSTRQIRRPVECAPLLDGSALGKSW
ncbi:hypothetical protein J2W32_003857 [Variovorax boronicumulans]|uniref:Transcription regulator AsnC/Lrp ligand binding domain-containing protein n=1 Tax=Variovorax boronicumulans TaxID=436515 RepID=A0AAW8D4X0_9BURK|nr:Lrp/AsnC ligand binding domain-containing protein [Variovorax boronicumulans]MDP9894881.1 hypothetical protein [Variovorax boronicumulans]MDQ0054799.1 hypothetical protein [Variovorax boronicumulans]